MRKSAQEEYTKEEVERRRDQAVRRALNTAPRPYKDSKVGADKFKACSSRRDKP